MRVHDDSIPKPQQIVVMSPSGVLKERMEPEDMYVLSPEGAVIYSPSPKPYPNKPPKCSDSAPPFMKNERLLGEEHIQTAVCYHALAIAFNCMGAYKLSHQHEKKTYDILVKQLGEENSRTHDPEIG